MVCPVGGAETAWETRKLSIVGGGSNTLRAGGGREATSEGTWEKSWVYHREKVPVLGRGEEEGWATIEYPHATVSSLAHQLSEKCVSLYIPSTPTLHAHARPETACHHRGLASPFAGS